MEMSDRILSARIYKYLSECFYFPDQYQLEKIILLGNDLPIGYSHLFSKNSIDELQVDFAKLFVGPFQVLSPPYGSVYLEEGRKTFGQSTADVIEQYRLEGLKVDISEPPDHIAIELEFQQYLIYKELEAERNGDINMCKQYINKQANFLGKHISTWTDRFSKSIIENAGCISYKELARALTEKIQKDLKELKLAPMNY